MAAKTLALFFIWVPLMQGKEWEDTVNEKGEKVQRLQIEAPAMTEEDQYGYNMPDQYRCDSCRAVVFHLNEALTKKQPKSRRLHEWEYQDLFDETCKTSFKGYGVSRVRGENVLSGPGLKKDEELEAGMGAIQMGGETWEKRLGEICRKLVYDKIGEDDIYDKFFSASKLSEDICYKDSRDCQIGPKASQVKQAKADKEPAKQKTRNGNAQSQETKRNTQKSDEPAAAKSKADERTASRPNTNDVPTKAPQVVSPELDMLDMRSFFTQLATEHGLPTTEYTRPRPRQEWDKLVVGAATKIFARQQETVTV